MKVEPTLFYALLECKVKIEAVERFVNNNNFVTVKEILALLGIKEKERKEEE